MRDAGKRGTPKVFDDPLLVLEVTAIMLRSVDLDGNGDR